MHDRDQLDGDEPQGDEPSDDGPASEERPPRAIVSESARGPSMAGLGGGGEGGLGTPSGALGWKRAGVRLAEAGAGRRASLRSRQGQVADPVHAEPETIVWRGAVRAKYDGRTWLGTLAVTPDRVVFLSGVEEKAPVAAGIWLGIGESCWCSTRSRGSHAPRSPRLGCPLASTGPP